MLVMLLGALDQTTMAAALPAVAASLGRFDLMPAVITAYLAAATVAMPLHGKLGDRYGRRPVLLAGIVLFAVGALLCATASTMSPRTAGRSGRGVGGRGRVIGARPVLGEGVGPRGRGRDLGVLGPVYTAAAVGGRHLGGLAVHHRTRRWIFGHFPPLAVV